MLTNSQPSIQVHKVRFVASTLLDAVRKAETAPASAARAHAYLCTSLSPSANPFPPSMLSSALLIHFKLLGDFLSILSEIERNYL